MLNCYHKSHMNVPNQTHICLCLVRNILKLHWEAKRALKEGFVLDKENAFKIKIIKTASVNSASRWGLGDFCHCKCHHENRASS